MTPPKRSSLLIAVWFVLVVTAPAFLWVVGLRANPVAENRLATPVPPIDVASLTRTETYQQLSAALEDRLPGRDQARSANRHLDLDVLDDSPARSVVLGDDGKLFVTDSWELVCDQHRSARELAERAGAVAQALDERVPNVAVALIPDKTFVEGAALGDHPGRRCADARRADYLATPRAPGVLDLFGEFDELRRAGRTTFWNGDSHTNFLGESVIVRHIVESLQPGLWDQVPRTTLPLVDVTMDLWFLLGEQRVERGAPQDVNAGDSATVGRVWSSGQPEPAFEPIESFGIPSLPNLVMEFRSSGEGPMIEGDTVMVGDSQMQRIASKLAPWFRHLTVHSYVDLGSDIPPIAAEVAAARQVVIECVERGAYGRLFAPSIGDRLGIDVG